MKNNACLKCGKMFHYCSSCGDIPYLSEGFCSEECMLEDLSTQALFELLKGMLDKLETNEMEFLFGLFDGEYANLEYPYFYNIVKERLTKN